MGRSLGLQKHSAQISSCLPPEGLPEKSRMLGLAESLLVRAAAELGAVREAWLSGSVVLTVGDGGQASTPGRDRLEGGTGGKEGRDAGEGPTDFGTRGSYTAGRTEELRQRSQAACTVHDAKRRSTVFHAKNCLCTCRRQVPRRLPLWTEQNGYDGHF